MIFTDDFDIGKEIDLLMQGAMQYSCFYRCRRKSDRTKYVVKVLNKAYFYRFGNNKRQRTVILNSLQNNMAILRTIEGKCNFVLPIQGIYENRHFVFSINQECKGGNLMQHIRQRMKNKIGFSQFEVSTLIAKIAESLQVCICNL